MCVSKISETTKYKALKKAKKSKFLCCAELEAAVNALEDGQVLLVENTRFEDVDGKKESKNDPELGKYWASLGDGIFVNDAFGTAHRAHASNVGISANVEKAVAGFLLENEIAYIQEAVETPERPFVAILGGSKVSDKIGVIENLLEKADKVLIGGGMTYTFYKAQGIEIGNSLVEEDKLDVAKALLEKANGKLILPVDSKEANAFAGYTEVRDTEGEAVSEGFLGLSGGVDSSVCAVLLNKAIGKNLTCIFVDHGMLRKNEFTKVMDAYKGLGLNVIGVDASEQFFKDLEGVTDPEQKRKIIGRDFVEVFNAEAKKITDAKWLAQGTIYPDRIESLSITGMVIKSHHNVGGLPEEMHLQLCEPLRWLFKESHSR